MFGKILVIGLGQIGYSNAEYMTSLGLRVDGYDIRRDAMDLALKNRVIMNKAKDFRDYDYYVICVSTHSPIDMFSPSLDSLFDIAKTLAAEGKDDSLVSVESTVTSGVCNRIIQIVKHRMHIAHVPHRFFAAEKNEHGVKQLRVAGGCHSCCLERAKEFYGGSLQIPLHPVRHIDIAELSKIVENSYRFVEIGFAEELKVCCDKLDINFEELREAVNTKWNIKILEARNGIGGHCLPKDSQMFTDLIKDGLGSSLVETARIIDHQYKSYLKEK